MNLPVTAFNILEDFKLDQFETYQDYFEFNFGTIHNWELTRDFYADFILLIYDIDLLDHPTIFMKIVAGEIIQRTFDCSFRFIFNHMPHGAMRREYLYKLIESKSQSLYPLMVNSYRINDPDIKRMLKTKKIKICKHEYPQSGEYFST